MEEEKSMNKVIVLSIIATLFVAGCSSSVKELEITTKPIEKPTLALPEASTLNLQNVEWFVINEENVDTIWQRLSDDKKDIVLFGLTDDGYEQLSTNMSDIMALVQQQKAIIGAYREYYEEADAKIDDSNSQIEEKNKEDANKKWWQIQ